MDDNWYALQQQMHDRITEARAAARTQAVLAALAPPHRGWYALGVGLIRLGSWVLARAAEPPQELARSIAVLRAALKSS